MPDGKVEFEIETRNLEKAVEIAERLVDKLKEARHMNWLWKR